MAGTHRASKGAVKSRRFLFCKYVLSWSPRLTGRGSLAPWGAMEAQAWEKPLDGSCTSLGPPRPNARVQPQAPFPPPTACCLFE